MIVSDNSVLTQIRAKIKFYFILFYFMYILLIFNLTLKQWARKKAGIKSQLLDRHFLLFVVIPKFIVAVP